MYEHAVVYRSEDSYCGPISMPVKLPDNEILLVFREAKWRGRPTHADPTTRMSMLRSRDGGRTWFGQQTVDTTGGNGCAVMRLSDGTLLANAYHHVFAPTEDAARLPKRPRRETLDWMGMTMVGGGVYMTRSWTDGYAWDPLWRVEEPADWPDICCHGAPLELAGGELLLPVSAGRTADSQSLGMVLRSRDRGATWREPALITDDAPADIHFHETRLALCPSGRVVAMHRTPEGNYWQNFSTDEGRTWSASTETPIWCGGSSPPNVLVLRDGRLLLTRGYRREPFGIRAYLSEDEGATWDVDNKIVLRDDGPDRDIGYPNTLELDNGRLLTIYYWHGEDNIRHLQSTSWELDR